MEENFVNVLEVSSQVRRSMDIIDKNLSMVQVELTVFKMAYRMKPVIM